MRSMLLIGALAACNGEYNSTFLAPRVESIDVLITSSTAVAFVRPEGYSDAVVLPEVGACTVAHEYESPLWSCLESIELGGAEMLGGDPPFYVDRPSPAATTLDLVGCGQRATIPVRAAPYLAATDVIVQSDDTGASLSWATTAPTSLVETVLVFDLVYCLAPGTEVRLQGSDYRGAAFTVTPLELETHDTALGPVHLWYGDETTATAR